MPEVIGGEVMASAGTDPLFGTFFISGIKVPFLS
jgi:hypothetical protein